MGQRERRDGVHLLAANSQRLPAGDDDLQPRCDGEELGDAGPGFDDLFEVVEDEEQLLVAQAVGEHVEGSAGARDGEGENSDDGLESVVGGGVGGEVDEPHAVTEAVGEVGGDLEPEPGLAGATGPGDGEQPGGRVVEHEPDGGEFLRAAEEVGGLERQVVGSGVEGLEGGEVGAEVGVDELIEVLGLGEILETMDAEVTNGGVGGEVADAEVDGVLREEHLPAVPGRHDASGAVHDRTKVVVVAAEGLAGVDAHPGPDGCGAPRFGMQRPLGVDARGHRIGRSGEDGDGPVAGGLQQLPVGLGDGGPHDVVVTGERLRHLGRVLLPETGARLDVGEEEGGHGSEG